MCSMPISDEALWGEPTPDQVLEQILVDGDVDIEDVGPVVGDDSMYAYCPGCNQTWEDCCCGDKDVS